MSGVAPVASYECADTYFRIPGSNLCLDISGNLVIHYHNAGTAPPGSGGTTPSPVGHPSGTLPNSLFFGGTVNFNFRGELPQGLGAVEARLPFSFRRGHSVGSGMNAFASNEIDVSLNNATSAFPYIRYGHLLASTRAESLFRLAFTNSGGYLTGGMGNTAHVNYSYDRYDPATNNPDHATFPQIRLGNFVQTNTGQSTNAFGRPTAGMNTDPFVDAPGRLYIPDTRIYVGASVERLNRYTANLIGPELFARTPLNVTTSLIPDPNPDNLVYASANAPVQIQANLGIGYQPVQVPADGDWGAWRLGLLTVTNGFYPNDNGWGVNFAGRRNFGGSGLQVQGSFGYFDTILHQAFSHSGCSATNFNPGMGNPPVPSSDCTGYFFSTGLQKTFGQGRVLQTTVSHLNSNSPTTFVPGMNAAGHTYNNNDRWYVAAQQTWTDIFGINGLNPTFLVQHNNTLHLYGDLDFHLRARAAATSWTNPLNISTGWTINELSLTHDNNLPSYESTSAEDSRISLVFNNTFHGLCSNERELTTSGGEPSDLVGPNANAPHNAMVNHAQENWIIGAHGFDGNILCDSGARFRVDSTSTYRGGDLDFDLWTGLLQTSVGVNPTDNLTLIGAVEANYLAEWWVRTIDWDPNPALTNPATRAQNLGQIVGTGTPRGGALRTGLWWYWDPTEDVSLNGRARVFFDADFNPIAHDVAGRLSHPGGFFGLPLSDTNLSFRYRSDNTATLIDSRGFPLDERLTSFGATTSWGNVQLAAFAAYTGVPLQAAPTPNNVSGEHPFIPNIARSAHSFRAAYSRSFTNTHVRLFNDQIPVRWSVAAVFNDCHSDQSVVGSGNNTNTFTYCTGGTFGLDSLDTEVGIQYQIFPQHTWTSELFVSWDARDADWSSIRLRNQFDVGSIARGNLRFYLDQNSIWTNGSTATSHYFRATATYTF